MMPGVIAHRAADACAAEATGIVQVKQAVGPQFHVHRFEGKIVEREGVVVAAAVGNRLDPGLHRVPAGREQIVGDRRAQRAAAVEIDGVAEPSRAGGHRRAAVGVHGVGGRRRVRVPRRRLLEVGHHPVAARPRRGRTRITERAGLAVVHVDFVGRTGRGHGGFHPGLHRVAARVERGDLVRQDRRAVRAGKRDVVAGRTQAVGIDVVARRWIDQQREIRQRARVAQVHD